MSLPSADLLAGCCVFDLFFLLILLCDEGLVTVDVLLLGVEAMLKVPRCLEGSVTGRAVCVK